MKKRLPRILLFCSLALLLITGGVLLREYLLLRRLEATLRTPPVTEPAAAKPPPAAAPRATLVASVDRSADGRLVRARVGFAAFKKLVESHPELIRHWGRVGWKVLEDIPALCIRSVAADAPFRQLGVRDGDCITHIDGETVNQPLRNMGIWLTLAARSRLTIDTLRNGDRISYVLTRY